MPFFATAALLFACLATLGPAPSALGQDGTFPRVCSGGAGSGNPCGGDDDCDDGVCVRVLAVCDGGSDDRFDCRCPGGACRRDVACSVDSSKGTCVGGALAGVCCDPFFGCEGGACAATEKICLGGPERGFGCLRDGHCPEGTCAATARVCRGGVFDGRTCVGDDDCRDGRCRERQACTGDCDASGEVTVDELVAMVSIALGSQELDVCGAGDANRDAAVTVEEIIAAVSNALAGCTDSAPAPTPTPV